MTKAGLKGSGKHDDAMLGAGSVATVKSSRCSVCSVLAFLVAVTALGVAVTGLVLVLNRPADMPSDTNAGPPEAAQTAAQIMRTLQHKVHERLEDHERPEGHEHGPSNHGRRLLAKLPEKAVEEPEAPPSNVGRDLTGAKEVEAEAEEVGERAVTPFGFDDIFDTTLRPRGFGGYWLPGTNIMVYTSTAGDLTTYNADTDVDTIIMANETLAAEGAERYWLSQDQAYILVATDISKVYRYSFRAKYKVFDRVNTDWTNLPMVDGRQGAILEYCGFSDFGSSVSLVLDYDLYYQSTPTKLAEQITSDGDAHVIANGIPDWLYEEEILGTNSAIYFSPLNNHVVYGKFDDTDVDIMRINLYRDPTYTYPDLYRFPYPKAGNNDGDTLGPNSLVTMTVIDTANPTAPGRILQPPAELAGSDYYFTRATWVDDTHIYISWANRLQNVRISQICDVIAMSCYTVNEANVPNGWTDVPAAKPLFYDDGNSYLYVDKAPVGQDMWKHLASVTADSTDPGNYTFLTSGTESIRSVEAYDALTDNVYYITTNGDPTERHLARVTVNPPGLPTCLTCGVGPGCRYVSVQMADSGKYYIRRCGGPDLPTYDLVNSDSGAVIRSLEDNADVAARLADKAMPDRTYDSFDLGNGFESLSQIYTPYNMTSTLKRFVQDVYAGPDSQSVTKAYQWTSTSKNFLLYLSSSLDTVIVSSDGRGSDARGDNYRYAVYRSLGVAEVEDQLTAANYFKTLGYIDPTANAASFGWSYGGFVSGHMLASDDAFQCAMSIAPVTYFNFYDTAYTERYMGFSTPSDNQAGYDATNLMAKAAQIKPKSYFMAHGTADDNVHYQNTALMTKALYEIDAFVNVKVYPDENHNINSPGPSRNMFETLNSFMQNTCW